MKPYRKWVNLFKTVLAIVVGTCSWKERANAVPRVPLECKARLRIQAWLGANATPEGGGRVWSYPYRHCGRQETVQLLNHCHWGARTGFFTAVGYWVPPRQCTKPRASGSETIQTATSNDCTESLQCNGHMDESDLFGWFKVSPPAKRVSADINRTSSFCKKLSIATPVGRETQFSYCGVVLLGSVCNRGLHFLPPVRAFVSVCQSVIRSLPQFTKDYVVCMIMEQSELKYLTTFARF